MTNRANPFKELYQASIAGTVADKMAHLGNYPPIIDIEVTNSCNIKCSCCPVGNGTMQRERGFMSEDTWKRTLMAAVKGGSALRFVRFGEPTLHKDIYRWIREAVDMGVLTHMNTNGQLYQEGAIVNSGLHSIKYSFQGFTWHQYQDVREGASWCEIWANIAMLHEDRGDNPYPYIVIGTTVEKPDKDIRNEIISFRHMADDLADLVLIGVTSDLLHDRVRPFMPGTCPEVCDKLSVNWNGDVTACCGDWDDMMIVGNINEEPIDKIWRGERITQIREMLAASRYKDLLLCRRCSR